MTEASISTQSESQESTRIQYTAPRLTCFGHVTALTAAGTGTDSELTPGGQINCTKNRNYAPDPTGNCLG